MPISGGWKINYTVFAINTLTFNLKALYLILSGIPKIPVSVCHNPAGLQELRSIICGQDIFCPNSITYYGQISKIKEGYYYVGI